MSSGISPTVFPSRVKEWFDIIIIIPLEEELLTLLGIFPATVNRSTDRTFRHEIDVGRTDLRVLVVQQEGMGRTHAGRAVSEALSEFDAGVVICLGIAGSLTADLRLGDVCYSNSIADVLDNARAIDTASGQLDIALSLTYFSTPREIVAAFNFCRVLPELQVEYKQWQLDRKTAAIDAGLGDIPGINTNYPKSADGLVVCAAVSKSDIYNQKLRGIDRKVLAVETESGGIFEEANRRSIPAITIRGISDHADGDKSNLEQRTGGSARTLAAQNAATFLKLQLSNTYFLNVLQHRRIAQSQTVSLGLVEPENNARDLVSTISDIGHYIDEQLRELSPDFKLQQKGYRLPTPRMRQVELGVSLSSRPDPIEIRDALHVRNHALLKLTRNYPDDSLPWVLANDLLTSEVNGKQAIPIVIKGKDVSPPHADFESASGVKFADLNGRPGIQLVFIIDELPLKSRSRAKYLEAEIKRYPDAKFFFITRSEAVEIAESDFPTAIAADSFELTGVSFLEISHFVQKNFGMTGSEAEVIALRLRETFRHFDLSAHPTYFAGISREVLSALLQANRRAELIQLAVDGFLTFVVAGDVADITLSRTTRLRFLRLIAVEINVEKRTFTQEAIVAFTKSFSAKFDFGIDPLAFVTSFIDAGILHFANDRLEFSLPFIESYVLASELSADDKLAARYFVPGADFDMHSFDLYAEIGASDHLVCEVIEGLENSIKEFGLKAGETHILLTDKIRPAIMSHPEQVDVIQKRLKKTAEDIELGRGDTAKKQRILDVADRVREEVADSASSGNISNRTEEEEKVAKVIQNWLVGILLLGAGAEHLSAEIKQMLAGLLVEVSSIIAHRASEALLEVDFSEIKKRLASDPEVLEIFKIEDKDEATVRRLITGLVDVLEYTLFGAGVRRVLQQLCEGARQKVLATSIEKAPISGPIEAIIHAAWLTDIESKRGKDRLVEAIKQLPKSPFLRSSLAAHFVTRVYWNHWRKEDRLVLLSAAEEAIKGLGVTLNKGELKRFIENSVDDAKGGKEEEN